MGHTEAACHLYTTVAVTVAPGHKQHEQAACAGIGINSRASITCVRQQEHERELPNTECTGTGWLFKLGAASMCI